MTTTITHHEPTAPAIQGELAAINANTSTLSTALAPLKEKEAALKNSLLNGSISSVADLVKIKGQTSVLEEALSEANRLATLKQSELDQARAHDEYESQVDYLADLAASIFALPNQHDTYLQEVPHARLKTEWGKRRVAFFNEAVDRGILTGFEFKFEKDRSPSQVLPGSIIEATGPSSLGRVERKTFCYPNERESLYQIIEATRNAFIGKINSRGVDITPLFKKCWEDDWSALGLPQQPEEVTDESPVSAYGGL